MTKLRFLGNSVELLHGFWGRFLTVFNGFCVVGERGDIPSPGAPLGLAIFVVCFLKTWMDMVSTSHVDSMPTRIEAGLEHANARADVKWPTDGSQNMRGRNQRNSKAETVDGIKSQSAYMRSAAHAPSPPMQCCAGGGPEAMSPL